MRSWTLVALLVGAAGCARPPHAAAERPVDVPERTEIIGAVTRAGGPGSRTEAAVTPTAPAAPALPARERVLPLVERPLCADETDYCRVVLAAGAEHEPTATAALEADLKKLTASEPKRFEAWVALGRLSGEEESLSYGAGTKRSEAALDFLRRARAVAPREPVVLLETARFLLALGRGAEAWETARELEKDFVADAEVQATLGIARLGEGDVAGSLIFFRRAARLDPKRVERHLVLGTAELLDGRTDEAERSFRTALALDPASAEANGNLGSVLLVVGRVAEGRAHLERAAALAPKRATFAANLAHADLLDGKFEAAEGHALRATRLDPRLVSGWLNLGLSRIRRGDARGAREAFLRAQALDPADPRVIENLRELDALGEKR